MNIVGKILVILNLVFALVVGGLVVVSSATSTNWQKAYEASKAEMAVASRNQTTYGESAQKLANEANKNKAIIAEREQRLAKVEQDLKDMENALKAQLDESARQQDKLNVNNQALLAESARLKEEVKTQLDIIAGRDKIIVKQQNEVNTFRNAAVQEENQRKAVQDRLEQALARNQELTAALQKATTGAGPDTTVKGKANPPSVYVEAKIEHIHPKQPTLVEISAGSDKGLAKNQTLEVYRMEPPMYLGVIRLVDVQPHTSIGRLEQVGTANRGPLQVGDIVASSLTR